MTHPQHPDEPPGIAAERTAVVLVVDDSELALRVLVKALQRRGVTVISAADGLEALDAIRTHRPELVLLDIAMPVLDGAQVAAMVRGDAELAATRMVAVTATQRGPDGRPVDRQLFDAFVEKPYEIPVMMELIDRFLGLLPEAG